MVADGNAATLRSVRMARRKAEGLPRAIGRLDRNALWREGAARGSTALLSALQTRGMIPESWNMRRLRVLARRHGPTSPVWRRRLATGTGAILVGLVALLFAELANFAIGIF